MKYAFMTFSTPQLTPAEIIKLAKDLGYDGVEPRIQANHAHGIEFDTSADDLASIRTQFEDAGVPLCCIATSCRYADPETLDAMVDDTKKAIDLAQAMGVPRLRVFGGQIGGDLSREAAIDQVADALASVAVQADAADVTICVETHDAWTDPAHVAAVMEKANHPRVAVNWDIMHPVRQSNKTMDEAFEALRPWIKHVHLHDGDNVDGKLVMLPIGEGIIDHRRALERLIEMGYDGCLSGEWINWEPYETHLPRELAAMKAYEAELVKA